MGKVIAINKEVTKERNTMVGKILPKRDFQKVIEHDKIYSNSVSQHLEFLTIKQDILSKKCEKLLNPKTQTRGGIIDNIDMLCDFTKTRIDCLDTNAKLRIQNKLVLDKVNHYEQIFIPQYNKEVEEMNKGFKDVMEKANLLANAKEVVPLYAEITDKVREELYWFNGLSKEDKVYEEYMLLVFKPLKRLINAKEGLELNSSD